MTPTLAGMVGFSIGLVCGVLVTLRAFAVQAARRRGGTIDLAGAQSLRVLKTVEGTPPDIFDREGPSAA